MAPSRRSAVTPRRLLTLLLVLVAASIGASVTAPQADAATPCWKRLINDWYDGRIDRVYPVRCYRAAIRNLPEDVDAYSTAREDLERALLSAARRKGGPLDPDDPIPPGPGNDLTYTSVGPVAFDVYASQRPSGENIGEFSLAGVFISTVGFPGFQQPDASSPSMGRIQMSGLVC